MNWSIAQLERDTADDGVVTAHYRVTLVDGDYTASSYGTCGFTPEPSDPAFTPFQDLTEADVIAWVQGSLDVAAIESALTAKIEDQKAPKVAAGVPW